MSDLKSIDELEPGDILKAVLKNNPERYVIGRYLYTGLFNLETVTVYIHMMYDSTKYMFNSYPDRENGFFHPCWDYYLIDEEEAMVDML